MNNNQSVDFYSLMLQSHIIDLNNKHLTLLCMPLGNPSLHCYTADISQL